MFNCIIECHSALHPSYILSFGGRSRGREIILFFKNFREITAQVMEHIRITLSTRLQIGMGTKKTTKKQTCLNIEYPLLGSLIGHVMKQAHKNIEKIDQRLII